MSMLWLDFIAKIKVLNWPFLCYDGIASPDFHHGLQEHNVQCDTNVAVHTVISKCFFLLFILQWFRLYCKTSGLSLAWNVPHSAFHCFYSCSLLEQVASKGESKGEWRNTWLIYAGYSVPIAQECNTVISTPESFQVEFCQIRAIKQCLLIITCLKQAGNSTVIQMLSLRQRHLPLTLGKWKKLQKIWKCCVLKPMWEYRLR